MPEADGKHVLGGGQPVKSGRKTSIDGHLHQDLDDLFAFETDIQSRFDMDLELWDGISHGGERCDAGNFSRAKIETRAAVDIAEGKFKEVGGKIGRNIGERRHDLVACLTVDLCERALAAFQSAFAGIGGELRYSFFVLFSAMA